MQELYISHRHMFRGKHQVLRVIRTTSPDGATHDRVIGKPHSEHDDPVEVQMLADALTQEVRNAE